MADHDDHKEETFMEKLTEKFHGHNDKSSSSASSSSSDSEDEKKKSKTESSVMAKVSNRLFGREQPVHKLVGGGKIADVFLWRDKKISAGLLGGATAIWLLFDVLEYHLLTFVCHALIITLAVLFLWSNASFFISKSQPRIPEVHIPEKPLLQFASDLRSEINYALATLRDIALGRDLKKFLGVVAGLWILSMVGNCSSFLTLFYTTILLLFSVPVFYEKYEDQVDAFAHKAIVEVKKQYAVFDAKVLSKIPRGPLKDKRV